MHSGDDTVGRQESRARALARLAALQRLREEAAAKSREAMLRSVEQLIEMEVQWLQQQPPGRNC